MLLWAEVIVLSWIGFPRITTRAGHNCFLGKEKKEQVETGKKSPRNNFTIAYNPFQPLHLNSPVSLELFCMQVLLFFQGPHDNESQGHTDFVKEF